VDVDVSHKLHTGLTKTTACGNDFMVAFAEGLLSLFFVHPSTTVYASPAISGDKLWQVC